MCLFSGNNSGLLLQYCLFQSDTLHSNTVTPCNILHHTATHPAWISLQQSRSFQNNTLQLIQYDSLQYTATRIQSLQHTATHCNTLQQPAVAQVLKLQCSEQGWSFASCFVTHCNTLQHVATYCNTPQHAATYCNTLQRTITAHHL